MYEYTLPKYDMIRPSYQTYCFNWVRQTVKPLSVWPVGLNMLTIASTVKR